MSRRWMNRLGKEVWVVVEVLGGVPERVWIRRSRESAIEAAQVIAEREGWHEEERRYWIQGDDRGLYLRSGELEPDPGADERTRRALEDGRRGRP